MKNKTLKVAWKDLWYYESNNELYELLNALSILYFKNNKWSVYEGFSAYMPEDMEELSGIIDEVMSEMNVKRENIKLVMPPSHIECKEITAAKYIKKIEMDKIKKAEKRLKEQQRKLKEKQKQFSNLKKAAKKK